MLASVLISIMLINICVCICICICMLQSIHTSLCLWISDNRPAAQSRATTDPGQLKLIEIMTQVKRGELSMEEANIFFEEWKIQHVCILILLFSLFGNFLSSHVCSLFDIGEERRCVHNPQG